MRTEVQKNIQIRITNQALFLQDKAGENNNIDDSWDESKIK